MGDKPQIQLFRRGFHGGRAWGCKSSASIGQMLGNVSGMQSQFQFVPHRIIWVAK